MRTIVARWKAAFLTGLAVVLPAAVSIGLVIWLFGTVANFTDTLLLFVPKAWTHARTGKGPTHLYWRVMALVLAILLVGLVGRLAGYYFCKTLIRLGRILDAIHQTLGEGGMYIQFQHSLLDRKKIQARFPNTRTVPMFLNFPPAVVYLCAKTGRTPGQAGFRGTTPIIRGRVLPHSAGPRGGIASVVEQARRRA